jgi:hypothetical protein
MATKKRTKKATTTAPIAEPSDGIHRAGEALLSVDAALGAHEVVERAPAPAEQADAAAQSAPESNLAKRVLAACRFLDEAAPYVWLTQQAVIGAGWRGTAIVPVAAPLLPEAGIKVDGKRLYRALRLAGSEAHLTLNSAGRLQIEVERRRFTLAVYAGEEREILSVPTTLAWQRVDPTIFTRVLPFVDPKVPDPIYTGVLLAAGACYATDKHSALVRAGGFCDASLPALVLPHGAFDGVTGDADGKAFMGVTETGLAVICDPATGEYRIVRPWDAAGYADVGRMIASQTPAFLVELAKTALAEALRDMKIVQAQTSSTKLYVVAAEAAHRLELRGGDDGQLAECVVSVPCRVQPASGGMPGGLAGGTGVFRICVSTKNLQRFVDVCPPEQMVLGFGATDTDSVLLWHPTVTAVGQPMRALRDA